MPSHSHLPTYLQVSLPFHGEGKMKHFVILSMTFFSTTHSYFKAQHSHYELLFPLQGKRYFKRFIKLLAIYTDLELCASIRGTEYDKSIAERIVLNYQTYLDVSIILMYFRHSKLMNIFC